MATKKNMDNNFAMPEKGGDTESSHSPECCGEKNVWHLEFGRQILWTLFGILLVYVVFYVGVLTRNTIKKYDYIGLSDQMERTIVVSGYGKVNSSNDIAVTNLGYSNIDSDVAKAQLANKKVMDQVLAALKKLGIEEKDLQSSYSIYPEYNYTPEKGQELRSYRVNNEVLVKIRNLANIPAVLNLAGKYGANQVGGLSFTIDDPNNLKALARAKAVKDAQEKAVALANQLGVRLVAVVSYNEYDAGPIYPMPYAAMMKSDMGGGGPEVAPAQVAAGSQDVAMNVNIVYRIISR